MLHVSQSADRYVQHATRLFYSQPRKVEQLKRDVRRDVIRDVNKMRNLLQRDSDQLRRAVKRDVNEMRNLLQKEVEQFKHDVKREVNREVTEVREKLHTDVERLQRDVTELREMHQTDVNALTASHNFNCAGIVSVLLMIPRQQPCTLLCSKPTIV